MILGGTNIEYQTENNKDLKCAVTSIAQVLVFNSAQRSRKNSITVRHSPDRETRLPLHLGLLLYSRTRKRDLIDTLFEMGLSVSYDRVLQLSTDIGNVVIDQFEEDGCPAVLKGGLFTTTTSTIIQHPHQPRQHFMAQQSQ